jgi:hypothetical protein
LEAERPTVVMGIDVAATRAVPIKIVSEALGATGFVPVRAVKVSTTKGGGGVPPTSFMKN